LKTVLKPAVAHSPLTQGEQEIIAIFVKMAQTLGAPRSLGEIYGLLFATPGPLAFQDIHDRLGLSKGSISQGLRFLRTVGAIQAVPGEGDRREYFEPVVELRALVGGFLKERINPQLAEWGVRAKALKIEDFQQPDAVNQGDKPETGNLKPEDLHSGNSGPKSQLSPARQRQVLSDRIEKLKTWQKRANTVLPMIGKLLG
jgi:HTH-type transcriptional regulator, glycine betaine synthesis regulator